MSDKNPWPLHGYAPGMYSVRCLRCGKIHTADKRATSCLECDVSQVKSTISTLTDQIAAKDARIEKLEKALKRVLDRDERNTCQHDETHRGGVLWEICDTCGAKWADDEGGKPAWVDPPEWIEARAALTNEGA